MASFKLLITLLLMMCPTNWALSMTSSDSLSVSSKSPLSSSNTKEPAQATASAAATFGDLYRKSRQSRCVRCYDDRYGDDYERSRYSSGSGGGGSRGAIPSGGYPSYPSRTYDERPGGNWYYPRETNDRYDESRVGYGGGGGGGGSGGRENDRYNYPYNGNYYERYAYANEDRYNTRTRTYDRYERDRYDSRFSHERSPSETRAYAHAGYESRDRYYPNDRERGNDFYRGDRYPDRNRGSSGGGIYDRYGQDDRYVSRYDYRNYRPWDETYRGQSGFDNSGRGYYFANERPNDYYEPPPPPPPQYGHQSRPLGPSGPGPSTPGPTYLPRDHHEQSRPSNSHHGYPDDRLGSSSSSSPSSSSSSGSSGSSGSDYGNRPRDDVHGGGSGGGGGGGGGGSSSGGGATSGGGDNQNGYTGGSWSYVNDREKDASYKGGIRDKDNQSSPYGGGRGGRPSLSGSYLLDRDNNNVPETSMAINPDKPGDDSKISDSPMASKLTSSPSSSSSSTSKLTEDRSVTESKDSN